MAQTSIGGFLIANVGTDTYNVMTSTCTHDTCTIDGFTDARFVCPCHGSQFSTSGAVLAGPASRALREFLELVRQRRPHLHGMSITHATRKSAGVAALFVCLGVAATATPEQTPARGWTVSSGDVRVTCPLTVGGSFEAKSSVLTGMLTVDPAGAALAGELSVDLQTLDTGIALRTEHMRNTYLEVQKGAGYDKAVLSNIDVGALSQGISDGPRPLSARLRLHGTTQPITGRATLTRRGASVRVEASFSVRIADYGIADPRYLGVGVGKEVVVKATFLANPIS